MWEDFVNAFADMVGLSSSGAGIMLSLLSIAVLIVLVNLKRRPDPYITIGVGLISTVMFTVMGWFPEIVGAAIGMVFAAFIGLKVSGVGK